MIKSYNFTKKDEVNSVSATPLQKFKEEVLTVKGAAVTERADQETGEMKKVAILVHPAAFAGLFAGPGTGHAECGQKIKTHYGGDYERDHSHQKR